MFNCKKMKESKNDPQEQKDPTGQHQNYGSKQNPDIIEENSSWKDEEETSQLDDSDVSDEDGDELSHPEENEFSTEEPDEIILPEKERNTKTPYADKKSESYHGGNQNKTSTNDEDSDYNQFRSS